MYILGGVALVGLAYYLYNRSKQPSIEVNLPGFANATGGKCSCSPCPAGFTCREYQTASGVKKCGCVAELTK
jgi:hypothetical protein